MPKGQIFINGWDAYTKWGLSMDTTALSSLMTPSALKSNIKTKSRAEHGSRVIIDNPKVDERQVTMSFHITAKNETDFFERYESFCEELETGKLVFTTEFQPTKSYRFEYLSCTQFSQFIRQMAMFSLKLNEPNPKDRDLAKLYDNGITYKVKTTSGTTLFTMTGSETVTETQWNKIKDGVVIEFDKNVLFEGYNADVTMSLENACSGCKITESGTHVTISYVNSLTLFTFYEIKYKARWRDISYSKTIRIECSESVIPPIIQS